MPISTIGLVYLNEVIQRFPRIVGRALVILVLLAATLTLTNAQWVKTTAPNQRVHRLFFDSTTIYAAYNSGSALIGPYRSTDNGSNWTSISNGLTMGQLESSDFAKVDSGILIGTFQGVWFSTNQGQNWTPRNAGLPSVSFRSVDAMATLGNDVFIIINTSTNGFLSTSRGLTWSSTPTRNGGPPITVHNGAMYVTGYGGAYKSTNKGTSWTNISGNLPSLINGMQIIAVGDTLYVCAQGEGVYRSTNGGASWSERNNGLPANALYVNTIAGNASVLLIGTMFEGVYLSTDGGASWTAANHSLGSTWITWLSLHDSHAYAGTDVSGGSYGLWRRPLSDLVTEVAEEDPSNPFTLSLEQNYPNPFNGITTIGFTLKDAGFVTLRVYDVLGREVARLVNEQKNPGSYSARWDATQATSGMYLYELQAGSIIQTRKLLLVR